MIHYRDLKNINQSFEPELTSTINSIIHSGDYLGKERTKRFEAEFSSYCGVSHCIGTDNSINALTFLLTAYKQMGLFDPDDEIIVPANTHIETILAVIRAGFKPVLCEPSPETLTINTHRIESLLSPTTKAIIAVHLYGQCADMQAINKIAKKYNLKVIEEASHATGAVYNGKRAGNLSDAAVFSFQPYSNLGSLGNAGAITTNDKTLADTINQISKGNQMEEIQAAVLSLKLKRLEKQNQLQKKIAARYIAEIDHPFITILKPVNPNSHVYHVFPVFCQRRDILRSWLTKNDIETRIHYPTPPHLSPLLPEYNKCFLPITEQIHREELSIPISPVMTSEQIDTVIRTINSFE